MPCYWVNCFHNSAATTEIWALLQWHIGVTAKELLSIVRAPPSHQVLWDLMACLWSHSYPRLKAEPCRAGCGCCPGAGAGAGCGAIPCLSASTALCQPCPSLALTSRFPEFSWSMAGLLEVDLILCWGHTDLPSRVWKALVPSSGIEAPSGNTVLFSSPSGAARDTTWRSLGHATMQVCLSVCVYLSAETLLLQWVMGLTQEV